jgi:hypothetical protein
MINICFHYFCVTIINIFYAGKYYLVGAGYPHMIHGAIQRRVVSPTKLSSRKPIMRINHLDVLWKEHLKFRKISGRYCVTCRIFLNVTSKNHGGVRGSS